MEENIIPVNEHKDGLQIWKMERAHVLGKWLWLYFWIEIAALIPGIIAAVEEFVESGTMIGDIIDWCCSAGMIVCLYQAGQMEDRLRTSAHLSLISLAATVLLAIARSETASNLWSIPGAVIGLIASYQYMHGCADSLMGVDYELPVKWVQLWKWRVGMIVVMTLVAPVLLVAGLGFGNVLLMVLVGIALVAMVGIAVTVMILEVVYTYRTAKIFRGIGANL